MAGLGAARKGASAALDAIRAERGKPVEGVERARQFIDEVDFFRQGGLSDLRGEPPTSGEILEYLVSSLKRDLSPEAASASIVKDLRKFRSNLYGGANKQFNAMKEIAAGASDLVAGGIQIPKKRVLEALVDGGGSAADVRRLKEIFGDKASIGLDKLVTGSQKIFLGPERNERVVEALRAGMQAQLKSAQLSSTAGDGAAQATAAGLGAFLKGLDTYRSATKTYDAALDEALVRVTTDPAAVLGTYRPRDVVPPPKAPEQPQPAQGGPLAVREQPQPAQGGPLAVREQPQPAQGGPVAPREAPEQAEWEWVDDSYPGGSRGPSAASPGASAGGAGGGSNIPPDMAAGTGASGPGMRPPPPPQPGKGSDGQGMGLGGALARAAVAGAAFKATPYIGAAGVAAMLAKNAMDSGYGEKVETWQQKVPTWSEEEYAANLAKVRKRIAEAKTPEERAELQGFLEEMIRARQSPQR